MFQHCSCSRKWVIISFIFQVIFSEDMKLKSRSLASLHVFSLWAVLPSIEGGTQVSYMSPPLNTLYLSYHQMLLILPSKSFFIISALFDILKSLLPTPCPRFIIIFHLNNCSRLPTWSVRSPYISSDDPPGICSLHYPFSNKSYPWLPLGLGKAWTGLVISQNSLTLCLHPHQPSWVLKICLALSIHVGFLNAVSLTEMSQLFA